ncbi:FAD-binding protein [Pullulanibacillus pueri]|uniref:FAD-binding protein n=1 Tax=Pullulanibacillus pueri TaxID=1437324 RepID=UPI001EF8BB1E|nr:FAD-binding protein [Pullulanibacillus pueri]
MVPEVVIFPESIEEGSKVVRFANKHQIPVVPVGIGPVLKNISSRLKEEGFL